MENPSESFGTILHHVPIQLLFELDGSKQVTHMLRNCFLSGHFYNKLISASKRAGPIKRIFGSQVTSSRRKYSAFPNKMTEWAVWDLFPPEIAEHYTHPELTLGRATTDFTLVIANQELPRYYKYIWSKASKVACADGGANRVYDSADEEREKYIPHLIKGDFDSVRDEVLKYYAEKGTKIIRDHDQDTTDLTKVLNEIEIVSKDQMIVILGALGGNLSQEMSNLNAMFQHEARLIFVSDNNITFLLKPGRHKIHSYETLKCGLIPIGNKVANISTEGLKWNLHQNELKFGGLISSSNRTVTKSVNVVTSDPVLWTFDFYE